ncbi:MAG: amidohydrolase family protein, partial [Akkermansiaceae bacterium]|nr:amidohydrolase family protein [Akkermansiaceae bacterium]
MNPLFLAAVLVLPSLLHGQAAGRPDLVVTNGKIVTVDAGFSIAEALAIRGDRIVAVGTHAEIGRLAGPKTRTVNLAGKTVLPGLIDSHVHAGGASMYEFDHPVPEMETIADVLDYIAKRAALLEKGSWIRVQQVFITRLRERRFPTRAELDRVAPEHPVWFRTGPDAALNSLALERSGIDRDFELPEDSAARIERDPESGEPTGIIRSAGGLVKVESSDRVPTFEDRVARLRELIADYNRVGLTGISDRNASVSSIRVYEELRKRGELSCRVYLYAAVNARAPIGEIRRNLALLASKRLHDYDQLLWLRGAKIFLDGGMLTGSAYMLKPWGVSKSYGIEDPAYRGMRYVEPEKLYQIAKAALENELQITAHAVGDGAVETLVDAYARIAENDFPVRDKRPCVTHCNFMSEDAIEKMRKYGIVADLQPAWLHLDGSTL